MIKLIRNHFYVMLFLALAACSSNTNVGQDDLSISEIEDIEKTGEFSEDEFFKDEEILKESGVAVDIEGLDDSNLESKNSDLASDVDVQDLEGEGFDKEDDFETDLDGGESVAEFDEFDEFVTNDKVAKNEEILKTEEPQIGDIAEQPTMTEEDIFSEFEESTDVAAKPAEGEKAADPFADQMPAIEETPVVADKTEQPDLNFEDAFNETETSVDTSQVAETTPEVDTTIDTSDPFAETPATEETTVADNSNFDVDFGPGPAPSPQNEQIPPPRDDLQAENASETRTAKELLSEQYAQPEQLVAAITRQVQSWIPVKKMKEAPFRQNDILLNALYIVREGDNFKSIGEKIYGKGSANNLAKVNPFLNPKRLKVGEKVYYNSPNRPNDENTMLFYYEDIGVNPQYREVNTGENIRTIAQELLGHPRSWMELWATNAEVVSKAEAERPYRVRYFSKNNDQSMVQETPSTEFSDEASNTTDPNQAATDENANAANELPDMNDGALADTGETDGLDNPDPNQAATTEEPNFDQGFDDQAQTDPNQAALENGGIGDIPNSLNPQVQEAGGMQKLMNMDQKTIETLTMGLGGLLLIVVILMIARRRRQYAQATQVQEFDFAGSTKIDEQTKTHIDI